MVWEIARLDIRDGHNQAFETALTEAVPLFARAHGFRGMQVQHSTEHRAPAAVLPDRRLEHPRRPHDPVPRIRRLHPVARSGR